MLLSLLAGTAYFLFFHRTAKTPQFESYPAKGIEADLKALDRSIYDSLIELGVPSKNVSFNNVETRKSVDDEWIYSDLEVRLTNQKTADSIEKAFIKNLSRVVPTPSFHVVSGSKQETIINISFSGHETHRITVFPFVSEPVLSATPSEKSEKKDRVSIIIDDIGYDVDLAKSFLSLDKNLSLSVLPHSPFQKEIAKAAHQNGSEVLLHLPMEPMEFPHVNPGKGALLDSMDTDQMLDQLKVNLNAVPFIVGVNNHMGSRLTRDSAKMRQIFSILKRRDLFFIDSVTSSESRCQEAATLLQLRFARRQVFLDHVQNENTIRLQIKRLITIAKKRGQAIGIGHPYPVTLKVLKEEIDDIKKEVHIVPVSTLTR